MRFALDRPVRERILAGAGKPARAAQLPRGMTPTQLAGGFGIPDARDLSTQIETTYEQRVETLPDAARRLLLVAAAEPVGDPLLLQRACERLGVALSAVDTTDGLLAVDGRVTFRHPLARSAVYRSASGPERRAAHLALAEVTDRDLDPDRRAWHLAGAAAGPDEEVARELELSADRAQARGGLAASAAFLQRAVALTGDPSRRAGRALAAARASLGAGAFDEARGLLAAAEAGPLDELGRARVDLLHAEVAFAQNRGGDAPWLLLQAARKLEPLDVRLARHVSRSLGRGPVRRPSGGPRREPARRLLRRGRRARAGRSPPSRPAPRRPGIDLHRRPPGRGGLLRRAVAAFSGAEVPAEEVLRWGWLASRAANFLWDHGCSLEIARRTVQLARDTEALETLAVADNACGQAAAFGGDKLAPRC